MDWLECMEREFFTNQLDRRLIEFLGNQGVLNFDNEPDKWRSFFKLAREWRSEYLQSSNILELSSFFISNFFMWKIDMTLAEFFIPDNADNCDIAELMKKIFLVGWSLEIDCDEQVKSTAQSYWLIDFEYEFNYTFEYPQKKCKCLSKERLIKDLRRIYRRSYDQLVYDKNHDENPKIIAWYEPSYPVFLKYIDWLDSVDGLQAVRINKFDGIGKYVWYIAHSEDKVYFIQVSDFG